MSWDQNIARLEKFDDPDTRLWYARAAIKAQAKSSGRQPFKGHPGEDGTREWLVTRYPNYLITYDVDDPPRIVHILRIWHQARER